MDNFDSQELVDVCVNQFIPEFSEATKTWRPLPESQRLQIGGNLAGTFAKLMYAFLWQVGALFFARSDEVVVLYYTRVPYVPYVCTIL